MGEKKCRNCEKQFDAKNGMSKDSPFCEECLFGELERFPILPPSSKSRTTSCSKITVKAGDRKDA